MKNFILFFIVIFCIQTSYAQLAGGTYTVGEGGTYLTLKSACDAANQGITGKVTFKIVSDLVETLPVAISNATNDSIIFKPDADVDRTITFNIPTANTEGPTGCFIIGAKGATWADISSANNIVVDGFSETTGVTRRLNFVTNDAHAGENGIFAIVDTCYNISIKNSKITLTGTTTSSPQAAVYIRTYTDAGQGGVAPGKVAKKIWIHNNEITSNHNIRSKGFAMEVNNKARLLTSAQANTAILGKKYELLIVSNNVFRTSFMGINHDFTLSPYLQKNEFHVIQNDPATVSYAIYGGDGNNNQYISIIPNNGYTAVHANKFLELKAASNGTGGAIGVSGVGMWQLINNYFTGFDKLNTGTAPIRLAGVDATAKFILYHNTFFLNKLTNKPTLVNDNTNLAYTAIYGRQYTGAVDVYHNIFISDEDETRSFLYKANPSSGFNGGWNLLYARHAAGYYSASGNTPPYSYNATYTDHAKAFGDNSNLTGEYTSTFKDVTFFNENAGVLDLADASLTDTDLIKSEQQGTSVDIYDRPRTLALNGANWEGKRKSYVGAYEGNMIPAILTDQNFVPVFSTVVGTAISKTVIGSGILLSDNITVSITGANANQFTVSPTSINQFSGMAANKDLTVTYSATTAGAHSAYLTLTSGALTKLVPLSGLADAGTGIKSTENGIKVMRTANGFRAEFEGNASVELFSINGMLIEKKNVSSVYQKHLNHGIYILKINEKIVKIVL